MRIRHTKLNWPDKKKKWNEIKFSLFLCLASPQQREREKQGKPERNFTFNHVILRFVHLFRSLTIDHISCIRSLNFMRIYKIFIRSWFCCCFSLPTLFSFFSILFGANGVAFASIRGSILTYCPFTIGSDCAIWLRLDHTNALSTGGRLLFNLLRLEIVLRVHSTTSTEGKDKENDDGSTVGGRRMKLDISRPEEINVFPFFIIFENRFKTKM